MQRVVSWLVALLVCASCTGEGASSETVPTGQTSPTSVPTSVTPASGPTAEAEFDLLLSQVERFEDLNWQPYQAAFQCGFPDPDSVLWDQEMRSWLLGLRSESQRMRDILGAELPQLRTATPASPLITVARTAIEAHYDAWVNALQGDVTALGMILAAPSEDQLRHRVQQWLDDTSLSDNIQDTYWAAAAVFQDADPNTSLFGSRVISIFTPSEDQVWCPPPFTPPTTQAYPYVPPASGISPDCQLDGIDLWGEVFVSDSAFFADFEVAITDSSLFSDLSVYVPSSSLFARSCGEWYFTDSEFFADFTVYFTDTPVFADFTIDFTDSSFRAGL